jgi:hypothetical protein
MNFPPLPPKAPTEVIDVSYGYSRRFIKPGETITAASTTVEVIEGADASPSDILSGSTTITHDPLPIVSQRIIGGVLGVTYLIQILATTSAGRKIMGARTLKIVQGGAP